MCKVVQACCVLMSLKGYYAMQIFLKDVTNRLTTDPLNFLIDIHISINWLIQWLRIVNTLKGMFLKPVL